jgi:isopropylmalate/homocitrate/citramalate synthase
LRLDKSELGREIKWGEGGKWWQSKLATWSLVRRSLDLPGHVTLMDQTIREGEDTPDVHYTRSAKFKILDMLQELGVKETEVGYVGAIDEHYQFARQIKKRGYSFAIGSHNRAYTRGTEWREEIDRSVDAGVDILDLVIWMSQSLLPTTPWLKRDQVPERITQCVEYAKSRGAKVGLLLADMLRVRLDLLVRLLQQAGDLKLDRIYVADGTGNATSELIDFAVRLARDNVGSKTKVALHCHDEFGLSLANALAGVKAGAEIVDVTVNGLGHNAGITALEEVATVLSVQYEVDCGIDLAKLHRASKLVEQLSGIRVSPNKPVVGSNIYRHQLDSHIASVLRGVWFAWDNIRPDAMGRDFNLEWTRGRLRRGRSGSVDAMIELMGLSASDAEYAEILEKLTLKVARGNVNQEGLKRIIETVLQRDGKDFAYGGSKEHTRP